MTEPVFGLCLLAGSLFFASAILCVPRRRRRASSGLLPAPPATWPLESLLSLLHLTPFDRLSPAARQSIVDRLRAADRGPLSMREHGRVNLVLGEVALWAGDRAEARHRFRAALRWDSRLSVRRLLARLDAPTPLSLTSRRSA